MEGGVRRNEWVCRYGRPNCTCTAYVVGCRKELCALLRDRSGSKVTRGQCRSRPNLLLLNPFPAPLASSCSPSCSLRSWLLSNQEPPLTTLALSPAGTLPLAPFSLGTGVRPLKQRQGLGRLLLGMKLLGIARLSGLLPSVLLETLGRARWTGISFLCTLAVGHSPQGSSLSVLSR